MPGDQALSHGDGDASCCPHVRLRQSLIVCSEAFDGRDFRRSDEAIVELIDFLDSIMEHEQPRDSEEAILEIHRFVSSASSNQMVLDAFALAAPKVVAKFAAVSDTCKEIAESVIQCLISVSNPRDMVSVFCEALDSLSKVSKDPVHFVLLLIGLSKVLSLVKRHHIQQVKVALPVVLNVLQLVLLDSDKKHKSSLMSFVDAAIAIATSIHLICENLGGEMKQKLQALFGLYLLQIMTIVSKSNLSYNVSDCISFMVDLSHLLPECGLSYLGLITGSDVEAIINLDHDEGDDDFLTCFSLVKDGASLAVIWGCMFSEIADAAKEQLAMVLDNLRTNQTNRWQAMNMLRYVLSSIDYSWVIRDHTIDLMLNILDERVPGEYSDEFADGSSVSFSIYSCMQAIGKVVIYAPDSNLRKKAFMALKKVLSDAPSLQQFDILKAFITNSNSPSMIALLIDTVKERVLMENHLRVSQNGDSIHFDTKSGSIQPCWYSNALELVEMVLKPPFGRPPSLPEHSDSVLSALNLYRFLLLTESTGKTNFSGVLSESNLRKAYAEWFLPLRTLVSGIEAETKNDSSDISFDILCSLNPVQLVLYRCIELVEERRTVTL